MFASQCLLFIAAFLIWDISADFKPVAGGVLIGLILANSQILILLCNPTEIVVGLCSIAVWCLLRNRFAVLGILSLSLSLLLKPNLSGFIWLAVLLVGGTYRRRALQTLSLTAVLALFNLLQYRLLPRNGGNSGHKTLPSYQPMAVLRIPALPVQDPPALE